MHNDVFVQVKLSNGRMISLEDLVSDYERLLKEEFSKKATKSELKEDKVITSESNDDKSSSSELKVGQWFRIDREVIDKSKEEICCKCYAAGENGKKLWKRFEKSNEIADADPQQYPPVIETYIFKHNWENKTGQQLRDMCDEVGDGMCDEVICDLELQMRICNGESVDDLVKKADRLPCVRVIKLRNGGTGYFGGDTGLNYCDPPATLRRNTFYPCFTYRNHTPYAFRRVLS